MASTTKFNMLLILALLYLINLVSSQTNQFFPESGRGFLSAGCTNWYIRNSNNVLTATCPDQVCNKMVTSSIAMDECLTNDNGNLYWNDTGYYTQSCHDCHITGDRYIYCPCRVDMTDDPTQEKIGTVDLNMGIITNYYGYLSCFGKVDLDRGKHNWPCKEDDWTPWGSKSEKFAVDGSADAPVSVTAKPEKTLFPQFQFVGPNATAGTNASMITVTVMPTS